METLPPAGLSAPSGFDDRLPITDREQVSNRAHRHFDYVAVFLDQAIPGSDVSNLPGPARSLSANREPSVKKTGESGRVAV